MTTTALAIREQATFAELERAVGLPEGSVRLTGLDLTDPDMTYEEWQNLGQTLGLAAKWTPWAIADWMLFGDALFGEDAAQAVEGTRAERYEVATRCTGLAPDTLKNYVSVGNRIAKSRRRLVELSFRAHEAVAVLEPDAQAYWLQRAVDEGWGSEDLRQAIRDERDGQPAGGGGRATVLPPAAPADPVKAAARQVLALAQPTGNGNFEVPPEPLARLREALGDE